MNPETRLPEVDEEKCTSCGACVKACPRNIIELRKKGPNGHRVYVQCVNKDKGAVAKKACSVACIGCGKCVRIDSSHFEMNGNKSIVISSTNLNSSNLKLAINNCPVQAIILE